MQAGFLELLAGSMWSTMGGCSGHGWGFSHLPRTGTAALSGSRPWCLAAHGQGEIRKKGSLQRKNHPNTPAPRNTQPAIPAPQYAQPATPTPQYTEPATPNTISSTIPLYVPLEQVLGTHLSPTILQGWLLRDSMGRRPEYSSCRSPPFLPHPVFSTQN